jgi:ribosomal protein S18 acetylase RimI-like enzyme
MVIHKAQSRAQEHLIGNWVNIVLAVISIIQGLAFNDLVTRFPNIYIYTRTTGDLTLFIHFVLCFIILLRIFQTYVTAVLDYNFGLPSFFEILLIFLIGAIEYFLFSSLIVSDFNIASFHKRLSIISVLGITGYIVTIFRILGHEELFQSYKEYSREVRLQMVNIIGMVIIIAISFFLVFFPIPSSRAHNVLVAIMVLTFAFNIYYSLQTTFKRRATINSKEINSISSLKLIKNSQSERLDIDVIQPTREDVIDLCQLILKHFGYVYTSLFDASERLTYRLLKDILIINSGKHTIGYKSFCIARDRISGETMGMLLLKTRNSDSKINTFISGLRIVTIVVSHLGFVGLLRTWNNWRVINRIVPKIESDELHIVYLAVKSEAQGKKVGKQLLEYAVGVGREEGKNLITLDVRENNTKAQAFFAQLGFSVDNVIQDDELENLLGQGSNIRMIRGL